MNSQIMILLVLLISIAVPMQENIKISFHGTFKHVYRLLLCNTEVSLATWPISHTTAIQEMNAGNTN